MAEQFGDKTHDATPHRRQKAREQGQVAKSQDLASASVLLGALLTLKWLGTRITHYFGATLQRQFADAPSLSIDAGTAAQQWAFHVRELATAVMPFFGILFVLTVAAHIGQVGFLFLPQKLALDPNRINPLKGIQRLFSLTNSVRLGFGIFKVIVVASVALLCVNIHRHRILSLSDYEFPTPCFEIVDIILSTCIWIAVALFILALLDFAFQKWKHEQDLKMTAQEVREEYKTLQGDPQVIARRRQVQRQLVANRLASAVPQADVIVTNPTELAVAIQYDPETMPAPVVVAKGAGVLAKRIRQLALENGIPVVERKPLARALYQDVDVNQQVPSQQYAAVAEVLKYVYELQGRSLPGQAA